MDKDRGAGLGKKVIGFFKETAGKITGDRKLQAKGTAQQTAGKAQEAVGGAKDAARDAVND